VIGEDAVFADVPDEEGARLGGGGFDEVVLGFVSVLASSRFVHEGTWHIFRIRATIVFVIRKSLLREHGWERSADVPMHWQKTMHLHFALLGRTILRQ